MQRFYQNMTKFKNKYRIGSARLKNWDYRNSAGYFVTICTKNRECFFGNIPVKSLQCNDSTTLMELTKIGQIAHNFWIEISAHFSFVKLDEFVVMSNHVHGIIVIDGTVLRKMKIWRKFHQNVGHYQQ